MRLYLVRHGQAVPETEDPHRPLTEKGKRDAESIAGFLKKNAVDADTVLCSTKKRAQETARIVVKGLARKPRIEQRQGLAPDDPVAPLCEELETLDADVMVVGHLPFLQELSAVLLTGKDILSIAWPTGALLGLERMSPGQWRLLFMITPDMV